MTHHYDSSKGGEAPLQSQFDATLYPYFLSKCMLTCAIPMPRNHAYRDIRMTHNIASKGQRDQVQKSLAPKAQAAPKGNLEIKVAVAEGTLTDG